MLDAKVGGILAQGAAICKPCIDRFPQHTLEWLSLPVLADPFWGRLPWLLNAVAETQQAEKVHRVPLHPCAREARLMN